MFAAPAGGLLLLAPVRQVRLWALELGSATNAPSNFSLTSGVPWPWAGTPRKTTNSAASAICPARIMSPRAARHPSTTPLGKRVNTIGSVGTRWFPALLDRSGFLRVALQ